MPLNPTQKNDDIFDPNEQAFSGDYEHEGNSYTYNSKQDTVQTQEFSPEQYVVPSPPDVSQQAFTGSPMGSGAFIELQEENELPAMEPEVEPEPEPDSRTMYKAHELRYYRFLFDVTTKQVFERILWSSIPYPPRFFQTIGDKPDLYGPFWIATTLIFTIQAMGNITRWFVDDEWTYDFTKLGAATGTIYVYLALASLVMYGITRYFSVPIGLAPIVALYGYSFFLYIPASLLSVVPFVFVRWVVIAIAAILSAAALFSNLYYGASERNIQMLPWLTALAIAHLGFAFACEFYFFEY